MTIAETIFALIALCHRPGPFLTAAQLAEIRPAYTPMVTRDDKGRLYMAVGTRRGDLRPLGVRCESTKPLPSLDRDAADALAADLWRRP